MNKRDDSNSRDAVTYVVELHIGNILYKKAVEGISR